MKLPEGEVGKQRIFHFSIVFALSMWGVIQFNLQHSQNSKTLFERLVIESLAPIQEGIVTSQNVFQRVFNNYLYIVSTRKENEALKERILQLEENLFKMQTIEAENQRLKKLLKFGEEIKYEKVLAQVIGWDSSGDVYSLRINKGSSDGIKKNATVINSQGLIGIISNVSSNYSDITTILDFNNKVDVLVESSRTYGILQGFGQRMCRLKYVTNSEAIEVDDILVTSGFGALYPKGIKVGKVKKITTNDYELTQKIDVIPSVNFSKVEEVIVLTEEVKTQEVLDEIHP